MQSVTDSFAPFSFDRTINFKVRFELLDVNARDAAVPSVSGQEDVSQLAQLTDGVEKLSGKYATLEDDCWVLDGTMDLLPDSLDGVQTGWWSDVLSGADGTFTTPPHLSFSFGGTAISTIGYTLCFDGKTNNYATSIRVTAYASDGTTVIEQQIFSNKKAYCVLDMSVQNYYSVKFEFLATSLPYRRIRLAECLFGIVQTFDGDSITSAKLTYSADIVCESFASRQLVFSFDNLDKKYNLINPNGLYAYLQEGQDLYATTIINGESVSMGEFEFSKAESKDDAMIGEITANDYVLSILDSAIFSGGSNATDTLQNAVSAVLSGTGITVSLENPSYTVSMAIQQGTTKREAIRLFAQAAMCSVWVDRAGVLQIHLLTVKGTEDDFLDADRMPSMAGITVSEPIEKVTLTVKNEYTGTETQYASGTGTKEKNYSNPCVAAANGQAVANWLLAQDNKRVRYDKPNRGNPAIEVGDTLKIYDEYGENRNAVVTSQEFTFDGGFSARTKGVGS
jgi:hypothetical protein